MPDIRPLSELTDAREFLAYLEHVGAELPFDADVEHGPSSPLSRTRELLRTHGWQPVLRPSA